MSTTMVEAIGWASSFVLLLTLGKQVHKQWKERSSEGVSSWLFVGQVTASAGFTTYSVLVGNWVFVATNALLLVNALVGLAVVRAHRRRGAYAAPTAAPAGIAARMRRRESAAYSASRSNPR